jgi:hypothetical protein
MSSIPLPALAIRPPESPLDQMSKMVQLGSLLGQQKLQQQQYQQGQLATQQMQQQIARENAARALASQAAQPPQAPSVADIIRAVGASNGDKIFKAHRQLQNSQVWLQNMQANYQSKSLDYLGALANSVKASGYNPQVADILLQHAASQPGFGPRAAQLRTLIQQNPGMLRQLTDNMIAAGNQQRDVEPQEMTASVRRQQPDVAITAGMDVVPMVGADQPSPQATGVGSNQATSQSTADPMNIKLSNGRQFAID